MPDCARQFNREGIQLLVSQRVLLSSAKASLQKAQLKMYEACLKRRASALTGGPLPWARGVLFTREAAETHLMSQMTASPSELLTL